MDSVVQDLTTVILAAGEGKRMRSRTPKMLHRMCGRPLIAYPLRLARTLADRVVMVVGPGSDNLRAVVGDDVAIVEQQERLGTGHAVLQAQSACPAEGVILVLAGDMPLLSIETLERLVAASSRDRCCGHRADRGGRATAGLRPRAPAGRARQAHRRGPGRHRRPEEGHRDQHQRLLLRRAAPVARARRAPARQRPGRVLPHRRGRAAGARRRTRRGAWPSATPPRRSA